MNTTNKFLTIILCVMAMLMPKAAWAQYGLWVRGTASNSEGFAGERYDRLFDHDFNYKWCCQVPSGENLYVEFEVDNPCCVGGYFLITGNDVMRDDKNRNPKSWKLFAKRNSGDNWTTISDEASPKLPTAKNRITQFFTVNNTQTEYKYFRWQIDGAVDGDILEVSEFCLVEDKDVGSLLQYNYDDETKTAEVTQYVKDFPYKGNIEIPEKIMDYTVTSIGKSAFYRCSELTSIKIPNTVTTIEASAFCSCSSLTSIEIPNSVTTMKSGVFEECHALALVTMGESVASIEDNTFLNCTSLNSIVIPNSVTSIGEWAFRGCTALRSLVLGNSLESIGKLAFLNCESLPSLEIPNSVTNIDESAFKGCSGLKTITIGDAVINIGEDAFRDCTGLTSLTIGKSVANIGEQAFLYCTNLNNVTCIAESVPRLGNRAFDGINLSDVTLHVMDTSLDAYLAAETWKDFAVKGSIYQINANCDESLGQCTGANKLFNDGDIIILNVFPKVGVAFVGWEDGNVENPRSFKVDASCARSYTALLRKGGFVVNVSTNDSELGTATAENVVYLEATPTTAGEFKQWSDGNKDNPRKIALESMTEDLDLTAEFGTGPMLINDGDPYTLTHEQTFERLNYARGYNNNVWSAWFVPFAVNATTLKDNGFDAAYIEGMHRYDRDDDGVIDETVMEVVKIKNGRLRAGTPYLVKAGETYAYPLSLTNVTVESANDIHNIETATATADYNFNGTYTGVTAEEVQAADNYYSMNTQGELVHRNGKILPLRWFMELIDKGGMYDAEPGAASASVIYVKVIGEEDNETGIRTIYPESEQKVEKFDGMFDLSGRRLSAPQRGINIINGKKMLIK